MSDEVAKLLELAGRRKEVVHSYLARPENPPLEASERQIVIIRLSERLADVQRLLRAPGAQVGFELVKDVTAQVAAVPDSREALDKLDLDGAWHLNDAFKLLLLELGNTEYLMARLLAEKQRTDAQQWTWMYERTRLDELIAELKAGQREGAVRTLTQLYDQRAGAGRRVRSQTALRSRHLRSFGYVIFVGLAGLMAVAFSMPDVRTNLLLAAAAGLIGATVASARTLRDDADTVRDTDWRFVVVPALGAVSGVVLYAIAAGKLLPAFDVVVSWGAVTGLGFIGGFSENFFLGTVNRIASGFEAEKKKK